MQFGRQRLFPRAFAVPTYSGLKKFIPMPPLSPEFTDVMRYLPCGVTEDEPSTRRAGTSESAKLYYCTYSCNDGMMCMASFSSSFADRDAYARHAMEKHVHMKPVFNGNWFYSLWETCIQTLESMTSPIALRPPGPRDSDSQALLIAALPYLLPDPHPPRSTPARAFEPTRQRLLSLLRARAQAPSYDQPSSTTGSTSPDSTSTSSSSRAASRSISPCSTPDSSIGTPLGSTVHCGLPDIFGTSASLFAGSSFVGSSFAGSSFAGSSNCGLESVKGLWPVSGGGRLDSGF